MTFLHIVSPPKEEPLDYEALYLEMKGLAKQFPDLVIKTAKQHPRPKGYYRAPDPPLNGIIIIDYITTLPKQ